MGERDLVYKIKTEIPKLLLAGMLAFTPSSRGNETVSYGASLMGQDGLIYDYCQLPENPTDVDRLRVGTPVPYVDFLRGDLDAIRQLQIGAENIQGREPGDEYQVVLIPSGYEDLDEIQSRMGFFTENLNRVFEELEVNFSYLNINVPIGLKRVGHLVVPTNLEELKIAEEKMKEVFPMRNSVIVYNSNQVLGSSNRVAGYATAAGSSAASLVTIVHEQLHEFGLSDGYRQYYSNSLVGNTEIFTSHETLHPLTRKVAERLDPPVVETDGYCNDLPVYTFYGEFNIMSGIMRDVTAIGMLDDGISLLNPIQKEFVREVLANQQG